MVNIKDNSEVYREIFLTFQTFPCHYGVVEHLIWKVSAEYLDLTCAFFKHGRCCLELERQNNTVCKYRVLPAELDYIFDNLKWINKRYIKHMKKHPIEEEYFD